MKSFYSILLLLLMNGGAVLAGTPGLPPDQSVLKPVIGEGRVRRLLDTAENQIFRAQIYHRSPDSALPNIRRAIRLADTLGSQRLHNEGLRTMAKYYFAKKDVQYGRSFIMQAITECQRTGDRMAEARCWEVLGYYLPKQDSTYSLRKGALRMAFDIYLHANEYGSALMVFSG